MCWLRCAPLLPIHGPRELSRPSPQKVGLSARTVQISHRSPLGAPVTQNLSLPASSPQASTPVNIDECLIPCSPEAVHLTQVLHQIQQRPLGAGRYLRAEAGRGGDRGAEGGRPFVDEPEQVWELQGLFHSGFYITVLRSPDKRFSQTTRRAYGMCPHSFGSCGEQAPYQFPQAPARLSRRVGLARPACCLDVRGFCLRGKTLLRS
jgi:hypothetical protein